MKTRMCLTESRAGFRRCFGNACLGYRQRCAAQERGKRRLSSRDRSQLWLCLGSPHHCGLRCMSSFVFLHGPRCCFGSMGWFSLTLHKLLDYRCEVSQVQIKSGFRVQTCSLGRLFSPLCVGLLDFFCPDSLVYDFILLTLNLDCFPFICPLS